MNIQLLTPMLLHVLLTAVLYAALTIVRAPTVWNIGANKDGTNPWALLEPKISANLSNQFEWPLFFYAICILLLSNPALLSPTYIYLAWVFIIGRLIHTSIHLFTNNIRLHGAVFTINFLAVLLMWLKLGFASI